MKSLNISGFNLRDLETGLHGSLHLRQPPVRKRPVRAVREQQVRTSGQREVGLVRAGAPRVPGASVSAALDVRREDLGTGQPAAHCHVFLPLHPEVGLHGHFSLLSVSPAEIL